MKPQYPQHTTNKLFYKAWPFKIATIIEDGHKIKTWGAKSIIDTKSSYYISGWGQQTRDITNLKQFATKIEPILEGEVKVRYEGSHVNLFFKDRQSFDNAVNELKEYIVGTWVPLNETEMSTMISNNKFVIVNQYPHSVYRHKVIFRECIPPEQRESLLSWLKRYPEDEFKISKTTERYFSGERAWAQKPFILVKNSKMLSMLALGFNNYIRKTEEYMLRSSINTES